MYSTGSKPTDLFKKRESVKDIPTNSRGTIIFVLPLYSLRLSAFSIFSHSSTGVYLGSEVLTLLGHFNGFPWQL